MIKVKAEILTIAEVAVYLKVAERTIYRLAGSQRIPAFKVGGAWRFSRPDIDKWIKTQMKRTPASRAVGPRSK